MIQSTKQSDLISFSQILISGLGILFFLSAAGGLLFVGLAVAMIYGISGDLLPIFNFSLAAGLISVLLVPSIYHNIRNRSGKETANIQAGSPFGKRFLFLLALWPLLVFLGELLIRRGGGLMLLGIPPLLFLTVSIPIFLLVQVGRRGIATGNPHRDWEITSFGLVITPPVAMLVEVVMMTLFVFLGLLLLSSQPDMMENLNRSVQRLANSEMNPEVLERVIRPYLQKPWVVYMILAVGAGVVPLIEELLKPLALWFLFRRLKSPEEGFSLGVLCGATFALLESLGIMATVTAENWAIITIARVGTALLHIVTTGLVGWGLVSAWGKERFIRLGIIFLLAVTLHSLWNSFGLLVGMVPFLSPDGLMKRLGEIAPLALAVQMSTMFIILIGSNHRLRQRINID